MFKHVDMSSAMRRLADQRIEEAMREGKFSNLASAGKPLDLEPMPADENARLMWWAIKLFRQNDVVPDEIRYRKQIAALTALVRTAGDEAAARARLTEVNEVIRTLNRMGTNRISTGIAILDIELEIARWREARQ